MRAERCGNQFGEGGRVSAATALVRVLFLASFAQRVRSDSPLGLSLTAHRFLESRREGSPHPFPRSQFPERSPRSSGDFGAHRDSNPRVTSSYASFRILDGFIRGFPGKNSHNRFLGQAMKKAVRRSRPPSILDGVAREEQAQPATCYFIAAARVSSGDSIIGLMQPAQQNWTMWFLYTA